GKGGGPSSDRRGSPLVAPSQVPTPVLLKHRRTIRPASGRRLDREKGAVERNCRPAQIWHSSRQKERHHLGHFFRRAITPHRYSDLVAPALICRVFGIHEHLGRMLKRRVDRA